MKFLSKVIAGLLVSFIVGLNTSFAANQTVDTSLILPETSLPFTVVIEKADFQLPVGVHSGLVGTFNGLWVLVAGSNIGLHGFSTDPFPPEAQNTSIYVVNPKTGLVLSRSLKEPSSGLNQQQIDSLSTISPQGYQESNTLYMSGGYGVDTATQTLGTKPVFTAIYLPGIIQWVTNPASTSALANIRQIYDPIFQITGGEMYQLGNFTQLIYGQNFTGVYNGSSGDYSNQVRLFQISDNGGQLSVTYSNSKPTVPDPNYRRRDLNILPVLYNNNGLLQQGLVAYAGVFTLSGGVWTVPVLINEHGDSKMADPNLPNTFKQGMNQYVCASAGLYSKKYQSMYTLFFGGLSFGFFDNGVFTTDTEVPFINQVTTIQMDKNQHFTQYKMNSQYPVIISTDVNPGNHMLFGAGAYFIPNTLLKYPNSVISLDAIRKETVIGYIVGGIESSINNTTNSLIETFASPYVFKVTLIPKR